jgi:hypothetical protein
MFEGNDSECGQRQMKLWGKIGCFNQPINVFGLMVVGNLGSGYMGFEAAQSICVPLIFHGL